MFVMSCIRPIVTERRKYEEQDKPNEVQESATQNENKPPDENEPPVEIKEKSTDIQ